MVVNKEYTAFANRVNAIARAPLQRTPPTRGRGKRLSLTPTSRKKPQQSRPFEHEASQRFAPPPSPRLLSPRKGQLMARDGSNGLPAQFASQSDSPRPGLDGFSRDLRIQAAATAFVFAQSLSPSPNKSPSPLGLRRHVAVSLDMRSLDLSLQRSPPSPRVGSPRPPGSTLSGSPRALSPTRSELSTAGVSFPTSPRNCMTLLLASSKTPDHTNGPGSYEPPPSPFQPPPPPLAPTARAGVSPTRSRRTASPVFRSSVDRFPTPRSKSPGPGAYEIKDDIIARKTSNVPFLTASTNRTLLHPSSRSSSSSPTAPNPHSFLRRSSSPELSRLRHRSATPPPLSRTGSLTPPRGRSGSVSSSSGNHTLLLGKAQQTPATAFGTSTRFREEANASIPGPGTYSSTVTPHKAGSPSFGSARRFPAAGTDSAPGPGSYSSTFSSFHAATHTFRAVDPAAVDFQPRNTSEYVMKQAAKSSASVGPGAYASPASPFDKASKGRQAFPDSSPRFRSHETISPGPGYFSAPSPRSPRPGSPRSPRTSSRAESPSTPSRAHTPSSFVHPHHVSSPPGNTAATPTATAPIVTLPAKTPPFRFPASSITTPSGPPTPISPPAAVATLGSPAVAATPKASPAAVITIKSQQQPAATTTTQSPPATNLAPSATDDGESPSLSSSRSSFSVLKSSVRVACPQCLSKLTAKATDDRAQCAQCGTGFPIVGCSGCRQRLPVDVHESAAFCVDCACSVPCHTTRLLDTSNSENTTPTKQASGDSQGQTIHAASAATTDASEVELPSCPVCLTELAQPLGAAAECAHCASEVVVSECCRCYLSVAVLPGTAFVLCAGCRRVAHS